jgi:hypothetical protein
MDLLPALKPNSIVVVYADHAARDEISHIAAELVLRGPLTVLDGGNRFQAYRIAHLLRRRTVDLTTTAERLSIQRAFTCYQVLALLENTPARPQPCLVLDLLLTFYDEQLKPHESWRLLEACLTQIKRLSCSAPVAVTLGQPLLPERAALIERVCHTADRLFAEELPVHQETQLTLF